jgi:hypothetical protein
MDTQPNYTIVGTVIQGTYRIAPTVEQGMDTQPNYSIVGTVIQGTYQIAPTVEQ